MVRYSLADYEEGCDQDRQQQQRFADKEVFSLVSGCFQRQAGRDEGVSFFHA